MDKHEFPCEQCGGMVDLEGLITVKLQEADGSVVQTQMPEWEARDLLYDGGLQPPPVICDAHERIAITVGE